MGTTAQKLEYLGTTKSQLKDMINYGLPTEQQITSSTTFRNYVSSIFNAFLEALRTPDTLFTNLPKKSGTGAVISLNDTANAPMRIELGASELTQAGTPTPSSPQDIHSISGSNKVVVCGKNLAYTGWAEDFVSRINDNTKANLTTQDGRKCLWFTAGAGYGEYDGKYIFKTNWKANTQYTISYYGYGAPGYLNACIYYTDGTYTGISGTPTPSWSKVVLTSTAGKTIKDFRGYWAGGNSYIDIDTFMVEEGSTATTYEPYISQEAEVDLSSKNIFDINDFESKIKASFTTSIRNSEINIKRSSATQYLYPLNCKANTQYTISLDIKNPYSDYYVLLIYSDNSVTRIAGETVYNDYTHLTITSTANKTITGLRIEEYGWNNDLYLKDIMLNEGTTALPYGTYYNYGEYCKIGNYEDKFIRTSGKNLFDKSTETIGYTIGTSDGIVNVVASDRNTSDFIPVESSTNYTCSATMTRIAYYNSSKTFISSAIAQTSITTPSNASYMRFSYDNTLNNVMLNEGSTALDYEPYGSNEWYIKKNIGKVVLDGTETITKTSDTVTSNFSYALPQKSAVHDYSSTGKSNYFTPSYNNQVGKFYISGNALNLILCMENTYTLETFKTWLGTNNTIVYYPIETPTYTQITGTLANQLENVYQKLLSYSDTTNISQINNDLGFVLDVEAVEEI